MGIDNVKLVFGRWTHVPDPGFRLLAFMALVSMDNGKPPLCWLSRDEMAIALGRRVPAEPSTADFSPRAVEDRKRREADLKAVQRALKQAMNAGAVEIHEAHAPGRRSTFKLLLHRTTVDATRPEQWTPDVPPRRTPYGGPTEDQLEQIPGSISPLVSSSPADELDYASAQLILNSLPDLGAEYMQQVDDLPGYPSRVVAAALLARAERNAS